MVGPTQDQILISAAGLVGVTILVLLDASRIVVDTGWKAMLH